VVDIVKRYRRDNKKIQTSERCQRETRSAFTSPPITDFETDVGVWAELEIKIHRVFGGTKFNDRHGCWSGDPLDGWWRSEVAVRQAG
jgi:hypothetical protein